MLPTDAAIMPDDSCKSVGFRLREVGRNLRLTWLSKGVSCLRIST